MIFNKNIKILFTTKKSNRKDFYSHVPICDLVITIKLKSSLSSQVKQELKMLKKSFSIAAFIVFAISLSACKNEISQPQPMMDDSRAVQKTLNSVQSTLVSVNRINTNQYGIWEVKVVTSSGALIKFEYFESTGNIREIHGLTGPFDYTLDPENGLMLYQDVRVIALTAKPGSITSWKLEKDESDNRWEYRFFISAIDGNWELRINAATGQLLRVKQK